MILFDTLITLVSMGHHSDVTLLRMVSWFLFSGCFIFLVPRHVIKQPDIILQWYPCSVIVFLLNETTCLIDDEKRSAVSRIGGVSSAAVDETTTELGTWVECKGCVRVAIFFLPCESEVGGSYTSRLRLLPERVATPDCCVSWCCIWKRLGLVVGALLDPL